MAASDAVVGSLQLLGDVPHGFESGAQIANKLAFAK